MGLAPSGCYGDDFAYFEAAHGTAPDIAGQDLINPTATLLSAVMMLRWLDLDDHADRLDSAITAVYADGDILTVDQGGYREYYRVRVGGPRHAELTRTGEAHRGGRVRVKDQGRFALFAVVSFGEVEPGGLMIGSDGLVIYPCCADPVRQPGSSRSRSRL